MDVSTNIGRTMIRDGSAGMIYLLKLSDALVVLLASWLAHDMRFGGAMPDVTSRYGYAALAGVLLTLACFSELGVYRSWRNGQTVAMYGRLLLGWLLVLSVLTMLSFLSKTGYVYSRLWFVYWAVYGLFGMIAVRELLSFVLRRARRSGVALRKVVLVGSHKTVHSVKTRIDDAPVIGYRVDSICYVDDFDEGLSASGSDECDVPEFPDYASLKDWLAEHSVHEIWLTHLMKDEHLIRESMDELSDHVVNIRWVPDFFAYRMVNHGVTELAGLPLIDLSVTPITGINRLVKEVEDRVLAFFILIMITPLLMVLALGVKLSSKGPVFFKQKRHGWNGKEIEVWKFRSMYVHEEKEGQVTQARRGDKRITPLGRVIRRTSLDELPQFINVLQGRMSIVGPRPHAIQHNEQYKGLIPKYLLRHQVKPGITGWAQVNGLRGETDTIEKMQARVEYDLYYIEHWSVWFDLRIIAQTALMIFFDREAY